MITIGGTTTQESTATFFEQSTVVDGGSQDDTHQEGVGDDSGVIRNEPVLELSEFKSNGRLSYAYYALQGERDYMEDRHVSLLDFAGKTSFFAVLDGHGGEECAALVKSLLPATLNKIEDKLHDDKAIIDAFLEIDQQCEEMYIAGTTLTSVFILDKDDHFEVICANVGDSRSIMFHNKKIVRLSNDHKPTLPDEIDRITKAGGYVAQVGPMYRVNGSLALSRAFGDWIYKMRRQLPPQQQVIIAVPEITRFKIEKGEDPTHIVLGSDGVFDVLSDAEVLTYVRVKRSQLSLSEVAKQLAMASLESYDNISIIIIEL